MDQMVSKVGKVMKKEFLDNVLGPNCGKSGLFSNLGLALGLGLGLGLGFAIHGRQCHDTHTLALFDRATGRPSFSLPHAFVCE